MKLRTRITLISLAVILAAILVSGCLLVLLSAQNSIQQAEESALSQSRYMSISFKNAVNESAFFSAAGNARSSLIQYLFREYARRTAGDADFILMHGSETVCNTSGYQPDILMSYGEIRTLGASYDAVEYTTVKAGNEILFLTRQAFSFAREPYTVYMVSNITQVYRGLQTFVPGAVLIGGLTAAVCVPLLVFLLKRALFPLEMLKQQAAQIAGGVYSERACPRGSDEIAALAQSFNAMAGAVERNINSLELKAQQQEMLLAAVAHEIKTPMTSVIGYADTLQRTRLTGVQQQNAISRIHTECRYMERLIQKLAKLIATDHAALSLREESTAVLLDEVRKTVVSGQGLQETEISVYSDGGLLAMDRDLMTDLLLNLIDNSRKAGSSHISIVAQKNDIFVRDDGCGIPEEKLAHVAQPFYKGDPSASRKKGGLGLGLALCQKIARLHGALLAIDSSPGTGTTVHIIFTN